MQTHGQASHTSENGSNLGLFHQLLKYPKLVLRGQGGMDAILCNTSGKREKATKNSWKWQEGKDEAMLNTGLSTDP